MSFAKSRLCGAILLILGAALLLTGIFASGAEREGTPLHGIYADSLNEKQRLTTATDAITAATEALDRAGKRAEDAISESEARIAEATEALETEQAGSYDPETDVGALGQAILEAQSTGTDLTDVADAYSPVYNAALLEALTNTLNEVKRAEGAAEDAATALHP